MRRCASSSRPNGTSVAPRRPSALAAAWSEVVRPAIAIALVGGCAVFYLVACARLSVIECDLRRLERLAQDEQGRELDLHRRIAELGNAERVRAHIVDRGLCRPTAVAHVTLTDVPEALHRTLTTGRATYWSRSREAYWVKGESSGHTQHVHEVRLDCDGDTVLLTVDQEGGACHTGDHSCFDADVLLEPEG